MHWSVCVSMRARMCQNCNNVSMWSSCLHARPATGTQCVNVTCGVNFDWVTYAFDIWYVICILIQAPIKRILYNWQRTHTVTHNLKICCTHLYKFQEHPPQSHSRGMTVGVRVSAAIQPVRIFDKYCNGHSEWRCQWIKSQRYRCLSSYQKWKYGHGT